MAARIYIGVGAIIEDDRGRVLLVKHVKERGGFWQGKWICPGGRLEPGESIEDGIKREVKEETGIEVEVKSIIEIFARLPGEFEQPHTSYHILYHCIQTGGALSSSNESLEVGFYDYTKIEHWHKDHQKRAQCAYKFWLDMMCANKNGF